MSRSALTCLLALSTLVGACNKDGATTTPTGADAPQTAAAPKPDFTTDPCKDWAELDPGSLPALPESPYAATFDAAWSTLLTKHYDTTLSCQDWPKVREWYGAALANVDSDDKAYALMNEMLGELGTSHLGLVPPTEGNSGEPQHGAETGSAMVPAEVRLIDGKAVIVNAKRYGLDSGLPAGATVNKIGDIDIAERITKIGEHTKHDVEKAFTVGRMVGSMLSCPVGGKKNVTFTPLGADAPKTLEVACQEPELETLTHGNLTVPTIVSHRMIEGPSGAKIGYVAFNIWLVPMMQKINAAIDELTAQGMTSLVIDLRGNPGGVGMMVIPLARRMVFEDVNLGTMRMRQGHNEFNVTATDKPFRGEVAVLIDEGSASTSEIFALSMQDIGRIKVFGSTRSPGAALPSLIEELPGGAKLQFVVADYHGPKGTEVEGIGVKPDSLVPETAADFAAGKDPVLDTAVAALSKSQG